MLQKVAEVTNQTTEIPSIINKFENVPTTNHRPLHRNFDTEYSSNHASKQTILNEKKRSIDTNFNNISTMTTFTTNSLQPSNAAKSRVSSVIEDRIRQPAIRQPQLDESIQLNRNIEKLSKDHNNNNNHHKLSAPLDSQPTMDAHLPPISNYAAPSVMMNSYPIVVSPLHRFMPKRSRNQQKRQLFYHILDAYLINPPKNYATSDEFLNREKISFNGPAKKKKISDIPSDDSNQYQDFDFLGTYDDIMEEEAENQEEINEIPLFKPSKRKTSDENGERFQKEADEQQSGLNDQEKQQEQRPSVWRTPKKQRSVTELPDYTPPQTRAQLATASVKATTTTTTPKRKKPTSPKTPSPKRRKSPRKRTS